MGALIFSCAVVTDSAAPAEVLPFAALTGPVGSETPISPENRSFGRSRGVSSFYYDSGVPKRCESPNDDNYPSNPALLAQSSSSVGSSPHSGQRVPQSPRRE